MTFTGLGSPARKLPCLHIVHRLIRCPVCGQEHLPVIRYFPKLLVLAPHIAVALMLGISLRPSFVKSGQILMRGN
jgi:hypothetical protein